MLRPPYGAVCDPHLSWSVNELQYNGTGLMKRRAEKFSGYKGGEGGEGGGSDGDRRMAHLTCIRKLDCTRPLWDMAVTPGPPQ